MDELTGLTETRVRELLTEQSDFFNEMKEDMKKQIAEKEDKSELARYVWKLKKKGLKPKIKWKIVMKARPYKKGSRYCDLCLSEKTLIAIAGDRSLNKRNEIHRKCTHMNQFKLSAIPI